MWKRGEIWTVNPEKATVHESIDVTMGSEIKKVPRWVVVISSDAIETPLPLKLVVPITGWQEKFEKNIWHIKVAPSDKNKLTKPSSIDVIQTRSIDKSRLIDKKGKLSDILLDEIVLVLNILIDSKLVNI